MMLRDAVSFAASANGWDIGRLHVRMELVRFLVEEELGMDIDALNTEEPHPLYFGLPYAYTVRVSRCGEEVVRYLHKRGVDHTVKGGFRL